MLNRILLTIGIVLTVLGGAGLLYTLTRQFPKRTDSFEVTNQLPQTKGLLRALPAPATHVARVNLQAGQREGFGSSEARLNREPTAAGFLHHFYQPSLVSVREATRPVPSRVILGGNASQLTELLVQTPSPTPTPNAEPKHRNPLSRFFRWLFGLFHKKRLPPPANQFPQVSVSLSTASITLACPEGTSSDTCTASASRTIDLTANAVDPDNDTLLYTWSVTGGRLSGDGRAVSWDLSGVNPGTYTVSVDVNDGNAHTVNGSATVTVAECTGCVPPCPTVSVSCPASVDPGSAITFNSSLSSSANVTYNWSVSAGTISSGQGTSSITVDTAGLGGQTVTATVEVGGIDPACSRGASCSISVASIPSPSGTPTPTPTPTGFGFNRSNVPLSSPAPTQTSTPSISPSPETSPQAKEVDKVELNYPIKLPVGWSERITVHFLRTTEQSFTPVIEKGGRVISTETPNPIPGATPGAYKKAWGPDYATFATVDLKALNLAVQPVSQARQSLDPSDVQWGWQISGKKEFLGKQTLHLSINVEGQKRSDPNIKIVLDNPTVLAKDFNIELAESWFTRTQLTVGSLVSTFSGAGVTVPWIYERIKGRRKPKTKKKPKRK